MTDCGRVLTAAALLLAAVASSLPAAPARAREEPTVVLRRGLVITRSVRIAPRTYRLSAPASLDSAVITIRGDDVTVDFAGARMEGLGPESDPDLAQGVAVRVEGGRNVRILHATIHGYRVGILARGTRGLELLDDDVSHTWKPRLFSLVEHESLVDWQSYHHNEHDEWLRWGAAIYLADVTGGAVRGSRAVQGANGLMLVRTDSLDIADNDFSFNSGTGIALYRSSWNRIVHNRVDYDMRGYSGRFYRRGQDSAGLLMYEQSSHNVVAWNSITHGGDGVFLWAGQSTMDSGAGGANDNLFFGNDFSWAAANGIEATFARNDFIANRSNGSEYGVWGGYSHDTRIVGNDLVGNRIGVAIEHGQDDTIAWNRIGDGTTGVSLWADPVTDTSWGYPRHRDVRSRDWQISNNLFRRLRVGVRARQTEGMVVAWNRWWRVDSATVIGTPERYQASENVAATEPTTDSGVPRLPAEYAALAPPAADGEKAVPVSPLTLRDRTAIVVDEWGPYDWRSPRLWPADSTRAAPLRLVTLGPAGRWRLVGRRGVVAAAPAAGRIGDTVTVTPGPAAGADWEIALEYRGSATASPRGTRRPAGAPVRFTYGRFEPAQDWAMRFFAWTDSTDPRARPDAFAALLTGGALVARRSPRLDLEWYRPEVEGLPQERFALEAISSVTLPGGGAYTLRTISDDAVRVWVDGALAVDDWTPHESVVDHAPLAGGRHEIRVQYYQVDGWVELRLDFVRGSEASRGTAGPH